MAKAAAIKAVPTLAPSVTLGCTYGRDYLIMNTTWSYQKNATNTKRNDRYQNVLVRYYADTDAAGNSQGTGAAAQLSAKQTKAVKKAVGGSSKKQQKKNQQKVLTNVKAKKGNLITQTMAGTPGWDNAYEKYGPISKGGTGPTTDNYTIARAPADGIKLNSYFPFAGTNWNSTLHLYSVVVEVQGSNTKASKNLNTWNNKVPTGVAQFTFSPPSVPKVTRSFDAPSKTAKLVVNEEDTGAGAIVNFIRYDFSGKSHGDKYGLEVWDNYSLNNGLAYGSSVLFKAEATAYGLGGMSGTDTPYSVPTNPGDYKEEGHRSYLFAYPHKSSFSNLTGKNEIKHKNSDTNITINFGLENWGSNNWRTDTISLMRLKDFVPSNTADIFKSSEVWRRLAEQANGWEVVGSAMGNNIRCVMRNSIDDNPSGSSPYSRTYYRIRTSNEIFEPDGFYTYSGVVCLAGYRAVPSAKNETLDFLECTPESNGTSVRITLAYKVGVLDGSDEIPTETVYEAVAKTSTGYQNSNPSSAQWFEKKGNEYSYTKDTTVMESVSKNMSGYSSKNPKEEGWYEQGGSNGNYVYLESSDTSVVSSKTYYKVSSKTYYTEGSASYSDGCLVTWSDDVNAWKSNNQPSEFERPDKDILGELVYRNPTNDAQWITTDPDRLAILKSRYEYTSTCYISGLSEGTPYYFKARRYMEETEDLPRTYGPWTGYTNDVYLEDPKDGLTAVTPTTKPSKVTLKVPTAIPLGKDLEVSWTFEGEGTQTKWVVHYANTVVQTIDPDDVTKNVHKLPTASLPLKSASDALGYAVIPYYNNSEKNELGLEDKLFTYDVVTVSNGESPLASGYYEVEPYYFVTGDRALIEGKTYYSFDESTETYSKASLVSGSDPSALGYYELSAEAKTFILTTDEEAVSEKVYYKRTDNQIWLAVSVATTGDYADSNAVLVKYSEPPRASLGVPSVVTKQPLVFTLGSNDPEASANIRIRSVEMAYLQHPDEFTAQPKDDIVYSTRYTSDGLAWKPDPDKEGRYFSNVKLPMNLALHDRKTYEVEYSIENESTKLTSLVADDAGTTSPQSARFTVEYERSPSPPPRSTYVTSDKTALTATIHLRGSEEKVVGNVCDIYRVTPDGATLIAAEVSYGEDVLDPFAPYSNQALTRYRVAEHTPDGLVEWDDFGYYLKYHAIRLDWSDPSIDTRGYTSLDIPYNLDYSDSFSKDFESRVHFGNKKAAGYWNENVLRKSSLSTKMVKYDDPKEKEALRALAEYPGPVMVRRPDGCAYVANVDVNNISNTYNDPVISVSFDITEIDVTSRFLASSGSMNEEDRNYMDLLVSTGDEFFAEKANELIDQVSDKINSDDTGSEEPGEEPNTGSEEPGEEPNTGSEEPGEEPDNDIG